MNHAAKLGADTFGVCRGRYPTMAARVCDVNTLGPARGPTAIRYVIEWPDS